MNFEQLFNKIIKTKAYKIIPKKNFLYFFYQAKLWNIKKQKLKLGSIIFEINHFSIFGFKIYEILEMRYTRQDNTKEDSIKIDNRLKALKWKWDAYNIISFIIIITFFFFFTYHQVYYWCYANLEFFNNNKYDLLLEYSLNLCFKNNEIIENSNSFKNLFYLNLWLNNALIEFCNQYNILK